MPIFSPGGSSVSTNPFVPGSDDGGALGSTTLQWSDLFLASGAVINFNNGDVTITHAANTLTLAGGVLKLPDSATTATLLGTTDAAGGLRITSGGFVDVINPNGVAYQRLSNVAGNLALESSVQVGWSSGAVTAAIDTGIRRDAAGSLSFTDGSTGHATGLGLGTATPKTLASYSAGADTNVLHVLSASAGANDAIVAATGDRSGGFWAIDSNAAANAKIIALESRAGTAALRRWADNAGSSVDYLTVALATDVVTLGSASVAGVTLNPGSATDVVVADTKGIQVSGGGGVNNHFRFVGGVGSALWRSNGAGIVMTTDPAIVPMSSGTVTDNAVDLGTTNYRWRDGWFSRSLGVGPAQYAAAPIGTVGSGTGVTVNATGDYRRVINKVTLTYAAWAAAATTADKTIYTLAAKQRLVGIIADVTATFTGGAVSDADMTCGKTAGGNEYLVSFDVDTATGTFGLADADLGTSLNRANAIQGGDLPSWTATTAITTRLTTVGANTNALTAGSITFYIITEMM